MQKRYFSIVLGALLFANLGAADGLCPDPALGENLEDCPWAAIARNLIRASESHYPVSPVLEREAPGLFKQLQRDASSPEMKSLWGVSINYDELAHGTVVHPAILVSLSEQSRAPLLKAPYAHAGIEHIYGYLFSVLRTPYGYKRARWVHGDIPQGLGLPPGIIQPDLAQGTLLTNVTYLIGRIAFRHEVGALQVLKSLEPKVAPPLRNFNFQGLEIKRLEESAGPVVLRTDFVKFPVINAGRPNTHLLIYSTFDKRENRARLITTFPVTEAFVTNALNPEGLGEDKPIITRYNAFVEGITGKTWKGLRRLAKD